MFTGQISSSSKTFHFRTFALTMLWRDRNCLGKILRLLFSQSMSLTPFIKKGMRIERYSPSRKSKDTCVQRRGEAELDGTPEDMIAMLASLALSSPQEKNYFFGPDRISFIDISSHSFQTTMSMSSPSHPAHYNATHFNATISCVYPLSDQYALLPRWNYYILILFTLTFQRQTQLIHAALGTIITYAGVTCIHAFVLVVLTFKNPNTAVVDLDILGVLLILTVTIYVIWPLLHFNRTLGQTRLRTLVRAWFVLVSIGTICAAVAVGAVLNGQRGSVCVVPFIPYANDSIPSVDVTKVWIWDHCNVTCTDPLPLLRRSSTLQILDFKDGISGGIFDIARYFGIVAASFTIFSIALIQNNGGLRFSCPIPHPLCKEKSQKLIRMLLLSHSGVQASLAMMAPLGIIFTELMLNDALSIPQDESPWNIGQWSCWAASGLLICAAVVDGWMQQRAEEDDTEGSEGSDGESGAREREKKQLPGLRDYKEFTRRIEIV
jgi:hypothetical protein